jgi:uncharacterized membrane protein
MYCQKCGTQVPEGGAFCVHCGTACGNACDGAQGNNQSNSQQKPEYAGVDYTSSFDHSDINANRGVSIAAYIWILFFLPLVVAPDSKFGRFHANQALINFLLWVACGIVSVPFNVFFWGGFNLVQIINIVPLGLMIYGIVNAVNGKAVELPVIGKLRLIT